jgi:diaminopimelate decarboxylase
MAVNNPGLDKFLPLHLRRLGLFPVSTKIGDDGSHTHLRIADYSLVEMAERFGTPLYLYDQATMETSLVEYQQVLKRYYPGETAITYAGKAFLCLAMAQWVNRRGLWLDCTGASEIQIAVAADFDRHRLLVHGVNKNPQDIATALKHAGTIVVDHLSELRQLAAANHNQPAAVIIPNLWLRLRPGVAVETHHVYTQTGQEDSKFGMSFSEAREAIQFCLEHELPLTGVHFHQGSKFHDPKPLASAIEATLDWIASVYKTSGWLPQVFSPGGGWGVAYHEDDLPHPDIETYAQFISECLVKGCQLRGLPIPILHIEPGRSLIARAGVAVYRVGAVKHTTGRRWLLVDGGMTDNIRPALYGASYSALPVIDPERTPVGTAWIGGPYCESGDILIENLPLPDLHEGELLAIPISGAYQISMSSNYNGACRPAVVWLDGKAEHLIIKRETPADLLRRNLPLHGL